MISHIPVVGSCPTVPACASEPLQAAREDFAALSRGAYPVRIDGQKFPGLPNREMGLEELRTWLLDPRCYRNTRDAIWAYFVRRARTEGAVGTAACVGLALPMLTRLARRLTRRFADDPGDLHAAVVAGFVHELVVIDLERPEIAVRLRWAAYRAGRRARREALDAPRPMLSHALGPREPREPSAHPDLVLARAVAAGVLTEREAGLISATRLGEDSLSEAARRGGMRYTTLHHIRRRAEARLAAWLTGAGAPHLACRGSSPAVTRGRSSAAPPTLSRSRDEEQPRTRSSSL